MRIMTDRSARARSVQPARRGGCSSRTNCSAVDTRRPGREGRGRRRLCAFPASLQTAGEGGSEGGAGSLPPQSPFRRPGERGSEGRAGPVPSHFQSRPSSVCQHRQRLYFEPFAEHLCISPDPRTRRPAKTPCAVNRMQIGYRSCWRGELVVSPRGGAAGGFVCGVIVGRLTWLFMCRMGKLTGLFQHIVHN